MKKKAVNAAFCLAVSLMLALAGCGSTAEEGAGGQTQVLDEREVEVQEEKEVVVTGKITMELGETGEAEQTPETEETKEAAGTEETEETELAAAETAEETKQAAASQSTKAAQTKESQAASSSTGSTAASKPAESQAASGSGTGSTAASKPAESQAASGSGTGSTGSTAASKPAEAHTHSFTSVKISDATCESGAVYEERCSCGATNGTHTEGSGLGHDYQYSGPYVAATCSGGGIDEDKCTRCGAIRWTNVPALPHSWTETLTYGGNCISPQEYTITCSVCGAPGGTRLGDYTDDHDWYEASWQDVDLATGEYITVTAVKCSRCNAEQ